MKRRGSKLLFNILLALAIFLGSFSVCSAMDTTAEKIITKKDSYDGKTVTVKGTVSVGAARPRAGASRNGG